MKSNQLLVAAVVAIFLGGALSGVVLDRRALIETGFAAPGSGEKHLDMALVEQAWRVIQAHYVDRSAIVSRKLTYGAISGMVDALGDTDHSVFLTPAMVAEERSSLRGEFAGIGAEVKKKNKHLVIVAPLDGSPAEKAGLRPNDVILKVDGVDVASLSLQKAVQDIKGRPGTHVSLTILSPKTEQTRMVTLTRARIHVQSVSWQMIPGTSLADVRIAVFSKGTSQELQNALSDARKGGADGAVLDLRSDPGGLFAQAISVASEFLHGGNVVLSKNVHGKVTPVPVKKGGGKFDLPMVVLINGGTASAAEIVSGALKDAKRAELVGEKTFGTGTVLQEFPLSGGSALLLAVREWLTPDGHSIWHVGIVPNVKVALPESDSALIPLEMKGMTKPQVQASSDVQLKRAMQLLRKQIAASHGVAADGGS